MILGACVPGVHTALCSWGSVVTVGLALAQQATCPVPSWSPWHSACCESLQKKVAPFRLGWAGLAGNVAGHRPMGGP